MEKVYTVEEGVKKLFALKKQVLPDYEIVQGKRYKTIKWNGKSAPLFPFLEHTKIRGLSGKREILGKPCAMTGYSVDNASLDALLFRELLIAENCFGSEVNKVTVFRSGNSANVTAKFENDSTLSISLHSAGFGDNLFKHELFNTEGMISNRAVDTVIPQQALNVYTKNGYEYYTDSNYALYGLNESQTDEVVSIYAAITCDDCTELTEKAERLDKITDVALKNVGKCVVKGEDF